MHEMEMSSEKPYTKCARVVGEVKWLVPMFAALHFLFWNFKLKFQVLGKFDPDKDDKTVYDSLVSMARVIFKHALIDFPPKLRSYLLFIRVCSPCLQNFSLRYPLIQGYGAFGSIDGHPAAAMRYTECRLDVSALRFSFVCASLDILTRFLFVYLSHLQSQCYYLILTKIR